jgi:hypothetical protein
VRLMLPVLFGPNKGRVARAEEEYVTS